MKKVIDAIVIVTMIICITLVSLKLDNTIVLGWYIVPGILHLFSIVVSEADGGGREDYD
jgi:hypothetical protein